MGLAEAFNDALYDHLTVYAAWFPVVNTIKVGDFGVIEDGVFRQLGNISKFGVAVSTTPGPAASIDFVSDGTTATKFVAGTQVDRFPDLGSLDAKLEFEFKRDNACLIRANLSVQEMVDLQGVAERLKALDQWENHFKVVSAIYIGEQCVIIVCKEANTKISISGKADILKQVELGKVEFSPSFESSKSACFKTIGETGVVGIRLFKLGLLGGVSILGEMDGQSAEVSVVHLNEIAKRLKDDL